MQANKLFLIFLLFVAGYAKPILLPYDDMEVFHEGLAIVYKDGNSSLINKEGELLMPFQKVRFRYLQNGLFGIQKDGKYGLLNHKGKSVLKIKFDTIKKFNKELLIASNYNKNNFILVDKNGTNVLNEACSHINYMPKNKDFIICDLKDSLLLADLKTLNIKRLKKDEKTTYSFLNKEYISIKKGNKKGLMDRDGKVFIEPKYEAIKFLKNGNIAFRRDRFWGIMDSSGKIIKKAQFADLQDSFLSDKYTEFKYDSWGIIDKNGTEVLPPRYDIRKLTKDVAILELNSKKYKYIDKNLQDISLFDKYEKVYSYYQDPDLIVAKNGKLMGLISGKLNPILPVKFVYINKMGDVFKATKEDKTLAFYTQKGDLLFEGKNKSARYSELCDCLVYRKGLIYFNGKTRDLSSFDSLEVIDDGTVLAGKKGDFVLIGKKGNDIKSFSDEEMKYVKEGLVVYKKGGLWGVKYLSGKVVIETKYFSYENVSRSKFLLLHDKNKKTSIFSKKTKQIVGEFDYINFQRRVKVDGKNYFFIASSKGYGLIEEESGKVVVPPRFDDIAVYEDDGLAVAYKGDHWVYFDKNGTAMYEKK